MRKLVRFLEETVSQALAETASVSSNYHLLTDSRMLYLGTWPHEIVDLLKDSRQPMFALCLSDTVSERRGPCLRREMPRPLSSGEGAFHAQGEIAFSGEFALRRVEWLLSSKS